MSLKKLKNGYDQKLFKRYLKQLLIKVKRITAPVHIPKSSSQAGVAAEIMINRLIIAPTPANAKAVIRFILSFLLINWKQPGSRTRHKQKPEKDLVERP